MNRVVRFLMVAVMIMTTAGHASVYAQSSGTEVASGNCGKNDTGTAPWADNVKWKVTTDDDVNYTLTISGTGEMADFDNTVFGENGNNAPWIKANETNNGSAGMRWNVTKVVIEDGVTTIGKKAFNSCNSIESVSIGSGVEKIGECAFLDCSGLTIVTIPANVYYVSDCAFEGCNYLSTVVIETVNISDEAGGIFQNCANDLVIYVPTASAMDDYVNLWSEFEDNYAIGGWDGNGHLWELIGDAVVLSGGGADATIINNVVTANSATAVLVPTAADLTAYSNNANLSADVKAKLTRGAKIGKDCAWILDDGNTSITLLGSGKADGNKINHALQMLITDRINIKTINISNLADIAYYSKTQNWGYPFKMLVCSGVCGANDDMTAPWGTGVTWSVAYIDGAWTLTISGTGAMADFSNTNFSENGGNNAPWIKADGSGTRSDGMLWDVKKVVIEDGVTYIGKQAFDHCSSIESVSFGSGVETIGTNAFQHCFGLTAVTIPANVTEINNDAFHACINLSAVVIEKDDVVGHGTSIFNDCPDDLVILLPKASTKAAYVSRWDEYENNFHVGGWDGSGHLWELIDDAVVLSGGGADATIINNVVTANNATAILVEDKDDLADYQTAWSANSTLKNLLKRGAKIGRDCAWKLDDGNKSLTLLGNGKADGGIINGLIEELNYYGNTIQSINVSNLADITYYSTAMDWEDNYKMLVCSGVCGANNTGTAPWDPGVTWSVAYIDGAWTLTISGSGKMADFENTDFSENGGNNAPWLKANQWNNGSGGMLWDVKKVVIEDGVTSIGQSAFDHCSSIESVSIGSTITSIGLFTFRSCNGLTAVTIPVNVREINSNAFENCQNLSTVVVETNTADDFSANIFDNCPDDLVIFVPSVSIKTDFASSWNEYENNFHVGGWDGSGHLWELIDNAVVLSGGGATASIINKAVTDNNATAVLVSAAADLTAYSKDENLNVDVKAKLKRGGKAGVDCAWRLDDGNESITLLGSGKADGEIIYHAIGTLGNEGTEIQTINISDPADFAEYDGAEYWTNMFNKLRCSGSFGESGVNGEKNMTWTIFPIADVIVDGSEMRALSMTISGRGGAVNMNFDKMYEAHERVISITVGEGVTSLCDFGFSRFENLETVRMKRYDANTSTNGGYAITSLERLIFNHCNRLKRITVPAAGLAVYKSADNWSNFATIIFPDTRVSVGTVVGGTIAIYSDADCTTALTDASTTAYIKVEPDGFHKSTIKTWSVTMTDDQGAAVSYTPQAVTGRVGVYSMTVAEGYTATVGATLADKDYTINVNYVDEDGTIKTTADDVKVYTLDGSETVLGFYNSSDNGYREFWYRVPEDGVDFDHTLTVKGAVHLILTDGKTMNITTTGTVDGIYGDHGALLIHGQGGTTEGTLNINAGGKAIDTDPVLCFISGHVNTVSGNATTISSVSGIVFYGGQITANFAIQTSHGFDLYATNKNDFMKAGSFIGKVDDVYGTSIVAKAGDVVKAIITPDNDDAFEDGLPTGTTFVAPASGLLVTAPKDVSVTFPQSGGSATAADPDYSDATTNYYIYSGAAGTVSLNYTGTIASPNKSVVYQLTGATLDAYNYFGGSGGTLQNADGRQASFTLGTSDVKIACDFNPFTLPGGYCGVDYGNTEDVDESKNVIWYVSDVEGVRTVTISGNWEMADFGPDGDDIAPWRAYNIAAASFIGVKNIGRNAFLQCEGLTNVTIPACVSYIGLNAFACCYYLRYVKFLGSKAPSLGISVFDYCEGLCFILANVDDKGIDTYLDGKDGWDWSVPSGTYKSLLAPATVTLDGTNDWSTYCHAWPVGYTVSGGTPYTVTGLGTDRKSVTLSDALTHVEPNVPTLIESANNGDITLTADETWDKGIATDPVIADAGWDFRGNTGTTPTKDELYAFGVDTDFTSYVISDGKFVAVSTVGDGIKPHRCWLTVANSGGTNARSLTFGSEGETTGTLAGKIVTSVKGGTVAITAEGIGNFEPGETEVTGGKTVTVSLSPDAVHTISGSVVTAVKSTDAGNALARQRASSIGIGGESITVTISGATATFTMPADGSDVALTVSFASKQTNTEAITYIDENGEKQTKAIGTVYVLDGTETTLGTPGTGMDDMTEAWYVCLTPPTEANGNKGLAYVGDADGDHNVLTLANYCNVHLILADGCLMTLDGAETAYDGISGRNGCSLTIYGQGGTDATTNQSTEGALTITAKNIAIYANTYLTINGGQISASGSDATLLSGTVGLTINGGHVRASSTGAPAIVANQGLLAITGGTVEATTTYNTAAAIHAVSPLNISGGTVTAVSPTYGLLAISDLTISGGKVTATCGYGENCYGIYSKYGAVNILGGQVEATSVFANGSGTDGYSGGVTLGWTEASDYINAGSYGAATGVVKTAAGKRFMANDVKVEGGITTKRATGIISGTVAKDNQGAYSSINDKMLCPITGNFVSVPNTVAVTWPGATSPATKDFSNDETAYYIYKGTATEAITVGLHSNLDLTISGSSVGWNITGGTLCDYDYIDEINKQVVNTLNREASFTWTPTADATVTTTSNPFKMPGGYCGPENNDPEGLWWVFVFENGAREIVIEGDNYNISLRDGMDNVWSKYSPEIVEFAFYVPGLGTGNFELSSIKAVMVYPTLLNDFKANASETVKPKISPKFITPGTNASGWSTYCHNYPIGYTVEDGDAYTIEGLNTAGNAVVLGDKVSVVMPGVPYLINGTGNLRLDWNPASVFETYATNFLSTDDKSTYEFRGNGTDEYTTDNLYPLGASEAWQSYVLRNGSFAMVDAAGNGIPANRCWLNVAKTTASQARVLTIGGDGGATTIDPVSRCDTTADAPAWHTLDGRRLSVRPTQKGVYVNGNHKVIIR